MLGGFGLSQFGSTEFLGDVVLVGGGRIAVLGDGSTHGGVIITTDEDGTFLVAGSRVAVQGALHRCPIVGHGTTSIVAVTIKSFHNSKLILTKGAVAGCGAVIQPVDRNVYVE